MFKKIQLKQAFFIILLMATFSSSYASEEEKVMGSTCAPENNARFLCGINNVEKLISVDGTRWAIASSAGGGPTQTPPMYFLNLETEEFFPIDTALVKVDHDEQTYGSCDKPDFSSMVSIGMDVRSINGQTSFYMVNHGGRMTTEVFDINVSDNSVPSLTWRGCITAPNEKWFMDDLAIFSDGSMIITNFFDPTDPNFVDMLSKGKPHGSLGLWSPKNGWSTIPTGSVSGPNGVVLSSDDTTVFLADWGGNGLVKIDLETNATQRVELGFQVDNLAWSQDGNFVLAGGQNGPVSDIFKCLESNAAQCDIPFTVVAVDPDTLDVVNIHGPSLLGVVGVGTGALHDGNNLWLTTFRSDRLPVIPYPLSR